MVIDCTLCVTYGIRRCFGWAVKGFMMECCNDNWWVEHRFLCKNVGLLAGLHGFGVYFVLQRQAKTDL